MNFITSRTLRACLTTTLMAMMALTSACFVEPAADPECFSDGEVRLTNDSAEGSRDSTICCDLDVAQDGGPDNDNAGNAECRRAMSELNSLADLAICVPDNRGRGVCTIDCGDNGEFCPCQQLRDCPNGQTCRSAQEEECVAAGIDNIRCMLCVPLDDEPDAGSGDAGVDDASMAGDAEMTE